MVHTKGFLNADASDSYDYSYDDSSNYDYNYDSVTPPAPAPVTTPKTGGGFLSGLNLGNLLTLGSNVYSQTLQADTNAANAAAAVQLEKLKIQQKQAETAAAASTSTGVVAKIKSYAVPIAVIGAVTIGGIAAYFYFKKKKVD